jgi:hypothetical protein
MVFGDGAILVRLKGRDPQCVVDPDSGTDQSSPPRCWYVVPEQAGLYKDSKLQEQAGGARRALQQQALLPSRRTLTCVHKSGGLIGANGYDNPNSWCSQARRELLPGELPRLSTTFT